MYKLPKALEGWEIKSVIRTTDNVAIPFDKSNTDYIEYLEWINEGNEPEPAD